MFLKSFLPLFLVAFCISAHANKESTYKINYAYYSNGTAVPNSETSIYYQENVAFLTPAEAKIQEYIDFEKREIITAMLVENVAYKNVVSFDSLLLPAPTDQSEIILKNTCKKVVYSSFSNTIEVWYTENTSAKGSPYKQFLPSENALVLKVIINGNRELKATSIEKVKPNPALVYKVDSAKQITAPELEELKIKSRYTTLMVFKDEKINFDTSLKTPSLAHATLDKTYRFSNGTIILKKIKRPEAAQKGSYVYAHLTCRSEGDAYDRTGSVFLLPAHATKSTFLDALQFGVEKLPVFMDKDSNEYQGFVRTESYEPPTEIMRFFTSFGVDYFNKKREINNYPWEHAATYKQEVTALFPDDADEIWIGVFIGNYSGEGHRVDLSLDFYPGFETEENTKKWILPLFCTVNLMEMSGQNYPRFFHTDTLALTFTVPENAQNLNLLFTTTGHGGWGGGDEFNPKTNNLFIDGTLAYSVTPWRTDCATYRLYNPASGNFSNGMSSSDLSRSNWCPATLTPPYVIPLPKLKPGKHTLKVAIDQGESEGGSFSHWGVSGILVGEILIP